MFSDPPARQGNAIFAFRSQRSGECGGIWATTIICAIGAELLRLLWSPAPSTQVRNLLRHTTDRWIRDVAFMSYKQNQFMQKKTFRGSLRTRWTCAAQRCACGFYPLIQTIPIPMSSKNEIGLTIKKPRRFVSNTFVCHTLYSPNPWS